MSHRSNFTHIHTDLKCAFYILSQLKQCSRISLDLLVPGICWIRIFLSNTQKTNVRVTLSTFNSCIVFFFVRQLTFQRTIFVLNVGELLSNCWLFLFSSNAEILLHKFDAINYALLSLKITKRWLNESTEHFNCANGYNKSVIVFCPSQMSLIISLIFQINFSNVVRYEVHTSKHLFLLTG